MGFGLAGFALNLVQLWRKLGWVATTKSAKVAHGEKRETRFSVYCVSVFQWMEKAFGSGRAKGTPNRFTAFLKEAIQTSFERLGGPAYLEEVGRRDPKTYCALLSKMFPRQDKPSQASEGAVSTLSDAEIRQRVAGMLREGLSPAGIETGEVVDAVEVTAKPNAP